METQNNAMNVVLSTIAGMDGPTLAQCLILSLVHNDALMAAIARDTIVRWAEHRFSGEELARCVMLLYEGAFSPMIVMDSLLHPPRLLLFGARSATLEMRIWKTDSSAQISSNVVFYATLSMLIRHHMVYVGHFQKLSHVWDFGRCFSSFDLARKCSFALAYSLRKNLCALMNFNADRWDQLWFSLHCSEYIPREELRAAYQTMLVIPAQAEGSKDPKASPVKIAAPALKKKKISQDKQVITSKK